MGVVTVGALTMPLNHPTWFHVPTVVRRLCPIAFVLVVAAIAAGRWSKSKKRKKGHNLFEVIVSTGPWGIARTPFGGA
jgi:protein-S-isoprenylcysteine O-methyltransferase Ste14